MLKVGVFVYVYINIYSGSIKHNRYVKNWLEFGIYLYICMYMVYTKCRIWYIYNGVYEIFEIFRIMDQAVGVCPSNRRYQFLREVSTTELFIIAYMQQN